jgi:hypothetical protein
VEVLQWAYDVTEPVERGNLAASILSSSMKTFQRIWEKPDVWTRYFAPYEDLSCFKEIIREMLETSLKSFNYEYTHNLLQKYPSAEWFPADLLNYLLRSADTENHPCA